jgi:hypothetical protein
MGSCCDADNNESSFFAFRLYCVGLYFMRQVHMVTQGVSWPRKFGGAAIKILHNTAIILVFLAFPKLIVHLKNKDQFILHTFKNENSNSD